MKITILRRNGSYAGAFQTIEGAEKAAYQRAVARGDIAEDTKVTWEPSDHRQPSRGQWWMCVGQEAIGWTVEQDELR